LIVRKQDLSGALLVDGAAGFLALLALTPINFYLTMLLSLD